MTAWEVAASGQPGARNYDVRIVRTADELDAIAAAWDGLVLAGRRTGPFLLAGWIATRMRIEADRSYAIATAWRGDQLLAGFAVTACWAWLSAILPGDPLTAYAETARNLVWIGLIHSLSTTSDERQHGVRVAVVAQRAHGLGVARGLSLAPELVARAAPQVQLAGGLRPLQRLGVHVGEREHLAGARVLDHAGDEPALVVGDGLHGTRDSRRGGGAIPR